MKISIVDVDSHNFPNLALMKISAYHKSLGDEVSWYDPLFSHPDKLYASKIFTFTRDYDYFPTDCDIARGGTGYDMTTTLPSDIEGMTPDYSIYPQYDYCIGFLTRGCVNRCPWCVVPEKEGNTHVVSDIRKIAVRKEVRLMDNNFLSADDGFVKEQLEIMRMKKWRIDFNQALDARLVRQWNAKLLAKVRWKPYIRFACDADYMKEPLERAVKLVRESGYKGDVMVYVLSSDISNALERIRFVEGIGCTPFCMPFRDLHNPCYEIPHELKRLARWCNVQSVRKSIDFTKYKS